MEGRPKRRNEATFSNFSGLQSIFEKAGRTVGLTVEIKLRFQISPVCRAFSKKLRFRDGLVWTVGLTGEVKLPSQIPPA